MRKLVVFFLLFIWALHLGACVQVNPLQRGSLADPIMSPDSPEGIFYGIDGSLFLLFEDSDLYIEETISGGGCPFCG